MSKDVLLAFRDTPSLAKVLGELAQRQELGRSEVLRVFVREGLERRGLWPAVTIETPERAKVEKNGRAT